MSRTQPTSALVSEISINPPAWREVLGRSTAVWATDIRIDTGVWSAFTGHKSADYNIVVCHDGPRGEGIPAGLDRVAELGAPSLLMVAGTSLGDVRAAVDAGWVCIGAAPFMAVAPVATEVDARVECVAPEQYPEVRGLVEAAFGLSPETALAAIPDRIRSMTNISVWGLRERDALVSCVVVYTEADVASIWSMATPASYRRRGYAGALMRSIVARSAESGARAVICSASTDGEPLYSALGFGVIERWQLWSRPRWVLGR